MHSAKLKFAGRLLAIAALVTTELMAQGERATVTGSASDTSGAIVIGAPVRIRNVTTNVVTKTTTNSLTQPQLRNYGRRNWDMGFIRNQPITERFNVQLRADITNIFNTPALSLGTGSSVTIGTPQFGQVLSGGSPRNVQLGLRVTF